jgi:hypothetical protein
MRRSSVFSVAVLLALCACGAPLQGIPSQSVPNVPPGYMRVTFAVAAPLDFSKSRYAVVFNTSGNGLTPEFGSHVDWRAYTTEIRILPSGSGPNPEVLQYIPNADPNLPPAEVRLGVTPSEFRFNPNSDGTRTEFSVTFDRSIFKANSVTVSNDWRFNAYTSRDNGAFLDSMGRCAGCFQSPVLRVNAAFARTIAATSSAAPRSARIAAVGFDNQP